MYKGPRIEDAFAKFEVIERRADLAEGHADSYELGGPLRTIDDEFADLKQDNGIQSELAAMKARLAKNEG